MALAYTGVDEMSHQLRFMLFVISLGLSHVSVDRSWQPTTITTGGPGRGLNKQAYRQSPCARLF